MVYEANPMNLRAAICAGYDENGEEILRGADPNKHMVVPVPHNQRRNDAYKDNALARTDKKFVFVKTTSEHNFDDLSFETTWRLLVLSTYVQYTKDASADGALMLGIGSGMRPMTKKDMRSVLGLSPRTFERFINEVCPVDENGVIKDGCEGKTCYLYLVDGKWMINSDYFVRGQLPRKVSTRTSRAFVEQIRRLHNACPPSRHKQLGMIARLLPWMNRQYNIICINPEEKGLEAIVPLTAKEIAERLNLGTNNSEKTIGGIKICRDGEVHYGNLLKALLDVELEIDGVRQVFCMAQITKYGLTLYVNPAFFYSGTIEDELRLVARQFVRPDRQLRA